MFTWLGRHLLLAYPSTLGHHRNRFKTGILANIIYLLLFCQTRIYCRLAQYSLIGLLGAFCWKLLSGSERYHAESILLMLSRSNTKPLLAIPLRSPEEEVLQKAFIQNASSTPILSTKILSQASYHFFLLAARLLPQERLSSFEFLIKQSVFRF